jgi:hypothetical protein
MIATIAAADSTFASIVNSRQLCTCGIDEKPVAGFWLTCEPSSRSFKAPEV